MIDPNSGADTVDERAIDLIVSEEHVQVGTTSIPVERIRFEKVIVIEEQTITVSTRREELRITRDPIDPDDRRHVVEDPVTAGDFEIVLHEERVIVTTEIVPVERVSVHVDRVVEQQVVTETVRKERVDVSSTES